VTRSRGNIDSAHSQLGRSGALSLPEASAVAERLYHVRAMAFDLPSERDQNVLLESESGERFVLKLANPAERREVLEAECAVMLHLEPSGLTPRLIRTVEGSAIGIARGVVASGRTGLAVIGFDSGKDQIDAIRNGTMLGAITQNPIGIGEQTVAAAVKAIHGEKLPKVIDTGFFWYDKNNIDTPEIQAVIYQ